MVSSTPEIFRALGLALALGLLVGLEREWARDRVAGIRTFALVTLAGALSGLMAQIFGGWTVAAVIGSLTVMIWIGNVPRQGGNGADSGLTTEMAILILYFAGLLAMEKREVVAVVVSGAVMVLLQGKKPLHELVARIGEEELRAIARLVLIGLVILPVLPDHGYGYFGAFNPFRVWLMVVLIVSISLVAYLVAKYVGPHRGVLLSGILGGLISSTATTASLARQSAVPGVGIRLPALVVILSSTVVFPRLVAEIFAVAPGAAWEMAPPFMVMFVWMTLLSAGCWWWSRREFAAAAVREPPSELKSAVAFAGLYALVLLGVAVAKRHFGSAGLFTVAGISGLTDMDAITLSTAGLVGGGHLEASTGWRVIMTGGAANLIFKAVLAMALGSRDFAGKVALLFLPALAGMGLIVWLWPD
ncbi:MAG: DUF4010 domain-containing protein [Verrucomicrobia bacterium]|nr:DUF4010 domain-containing protein [Verrucomicrobiota bacterium]